MGVIHSCNKKKGGDGTQNAFLNTSKKVSISHVFIYLF